MQLFKSIVPDLLSFKWYQGIGIVLFCAISVCFSVVDFNHFIHKGQYPNVLQWDNGVGDGVVRWKLILMALSGAASFSGVLSVVLTTVGKFSNFFWGIINCITYGAFAFAYSYGGDAQINIIYFLPFQFIGMYKWSKMMQNGTVISRSASVYQMLLAFLLAGGASVGLYYEIPVFTTAIGGSYPYLNYKTPRILDAVSSGCNIVGQLLLVGGFWQQWIFWIAVDCMQIAMFSGITIFGLNINIIIMWSLFLINALFGIVVWYRASKKSAPAKENTRIPLAELTEIRSGRGLIIGKFYPFHAGHEYLIGTALKHSEKVIIILCYRIIDQPPGPTRIEWLKRTYAQNSNIEILSYQYDESKESSVDSALWARQTLVCLNNVKPDVVYTSEDYGDTFASHLKCRHYLVDKERVKYPVHGRAIRANPDKYLPYLNSIVRAYYIKKFVLIGSESTWKTTLVQDIAKHFHVASISEYGREVATRGYKIWEEKDFIDIATTQTDRENKVLENPTYVEKLIICDTDAFATHVWHHRYMQSTFNQQIVDIFTNKMKPANIYFLSDPEPPFVQDGTRDGELIRKNMHEIFKEQLATYRLPYVILTGTYEERLGKAITLIDKSY
ncbi:MAG: hypothetical protein Hyperionvirus13_42 [Hyperionvirus sp.]|uniref:NadR/Ttd14 AAA domain-containing protein n=1 Tax=Hyperionvirus sp. TaxID=2487770 RepID=A0A3G5AEV7_9VIRU|nr:MAG: hypothetical protein Hyperionvirus13_42 [Hyperionvirus sp.]